MMCGSEPVDTGVFIASVIAFVIVAGVCLWHIVKKG